MRLKGLALFGFVLLFVVGFCARQHRADPPASVYVVVDPATNQTRPKAQQDSILDAQPVDPVFHWLGWLAMAAAVIGFVGYGLYSAKNFNPETVKPGG